MWYLYRRALTDVITDDGPPPISYREWLLCNLNPTTVARSWAPAWRR